LTTPGKAVADCTHDKHCRIDALENISGAVPGIDLFEMVSIKSAAMVGGLSAATSALAKAFASRRITDGI
jgi:hypothetical protein